MKKDTSSFSSYSLLFTPQKEELRRIKVQQLLKGPRIYMWQRIIPGLFLQTKHAMIRGNFPVKVSQIPAESRVA